MEARAARASGWVPLLAVAALLAAALALWQLYAGEAGVQRQDAAVDGTPVTVYSPAGGASGHGRCSSLLLTDGDEDPEG